MAFMSLGKTVGAIVILVILTAPDECNCLGVAENGIVVRDLLRHINRPLELTLMSCWSFEEKMMFLQSIDGHAIAALNDDVQYFPRNLNDHQSVIVVDLRCPRTERLLSTVGQPLYLNHRWILLNSKECNETEEEKDEVTLLEILGKLPILVSSELYYFLANEDSVDIKQAYRTTINDPVIVELYGQWTNSSIIDYRRNSVTSQRRSNLRQSTIRASLVVTNNQTLKHLTDYKDKHIDTITKVNYILTNHLISSLNASVNYSVVDTWGYKDNQTGEWGGMIGQLVTNETDLGASPLFFTDDRIPIIQYIAMTSATRSKFVFRSPKLSYTDNVFVLPFDRFVWYSAFALILITSTFLLLTTLAEWRFHLANNTEDADSADILRPNFLDNLLLVFSATCQQGSSTTPRSFSARIIAMLCFTVLMFLYASYSANIVALLQSPSTKIKTLKDLLNSRLKFGVDDTVFNRYYFSHANEKIRKAIFEQKIKRKDGGLNYIALESGVEKMRRGLFAFHMELGVGYKLVSETFREDEKCGLQEIQYLQVIDPWYAIQKNSSFREMFKIGLFRLNENGLQERENSILYTKKPICSGSGGNFISVGIIDIEPALLIIAWGTAFALVFLVLECIIYKFEWRRCRRTIVARTCRK